MVGAPLRPCSTFSIDAIELSGPQDTVSLRGLSALVTTALRTRSYRAFEQNTLAAIARRIAPKHHLTLEGQITPLTLERVTQQHETDLAFLRWLAEEYGYILKVTPSRLIFLSASDYEKPRRLTSLPRKLSVITACAIRLTVSTSRAK